MGQEKHSNKKNRLNKLKRYYDECAEELGLDKCTSILEQIHILVDEADKIQGQICALSDSIKIDDLEKVQEFTPITRQTYTDFVKLCMLKNNGKLNEKVVSRFEEDFAKRLVDTNIRHSFIESYINGDELKITNEDHERYEPFDDFKDDEFNKILDKSIGTREVITYQLMPQYRVLANIAEYITQGELQYPQFKMLVDFQHYKDGGYPSETSPSKLWAIFNTFNEAYRLLDKYDYSKVLKEHNYEFGLDINLGSPHPEQHPWQEE